MNKKDILKNLKNIKTKGPTETLFGICTNVFPSEYYTKFNSDDMGVLYTLFGSWENFSGNFGYPIVDSGAIYKFSDAKILYKTTKNKWDKSTEYGQLRWELLDFLIDELQKLVDSESVNC